MFNRKKKEMMVYVILGFLEAGKTSLIRDLVTDDMFDGNAKTLILACEEGEEEYTQEVLQKGFPPVSILRMRTHLMEKYLKSF